MKCIECGKTIKKDEECYEVYAEFIFCKDCIRKMGERVGQYTVYKNPEEFIKQFREEITKIDADIERIKIIISARPEYTNVFNNLIAGHQWKIKALQEKIKRFEEE